MSGLSYDKRKFWKYVNSKIKGIAHVLHVFGVINILFEEIVEDLKAGKKIKIFNFATLELKVLPPRKYYHLWKQQVLMSKGSKMLKFKMIPRFKKKIMEHLDKIGPEAK